MTAFRASDRRDEPALLRAARAGQAQAFDEIHRRYRRPLAAYTGRLLGPGHPAVDDVLQDVFWRLHAELARGRPIALRPWLFRVAHNRAIDVLRSERAAAALAEETAEPATAPLWMEVAHREAVREVLADLAELAPRQRLALLAVVAGRGHEHVARELGTTVGASKSLTNRARIRLLERRAARSGERMAA